MSCMHAFALSWHLQLSGISSWVWNDHHLREIMHQPNWSHTTGDKPYMQHSMLHEPDRAELQLSWCQGTQPVGHNAPNYLVYISSLSPALQSLYLSLFTRFSPSIFQHSTHTFDNHPLRLVLPSFSPCGAKPGFTLASSRLSLCVSALPVRHQVEKRSVLYLVTKSTRHWRRSVVPLLGPLAFFRKFYTSI